MSDERQIPHDAIMLRVDQAARILQVPRSTLYEAIQRNEVPGVVKIGRHLRISRAAMLAWSPGVGPLSRSRRKA